MSRFEELLDALVAACFEYSVAAPLDAAARLVDVTAARAALVDYHRGLERIIDERIMAALTKPTASAAPLEESSGSVRAALPPLGSAE